MATRLTEERWQQLLHAFRIGAANETYRALLEAYAEKHRHYHTAQHSDADYDVFERNIREEYRWVPSFVFRKKRAEILQSFLDRTHLYNTDFFHEHYEAQARKNLRRAIQALSS